MPDSTPTPTGQHPALDAQQNADIEQLKKESLDARDHRTVMKTLMTLTGACALIVFLGAVSVRDSTLATAARVTALEERTSAVESSSHQRDTDDRGTREAIVRLTITVDALRSQVEAMRSEMQSARASRTP